MRLIAIVVLACAGVVCAQVPTIAVSPGSAAVMTQTSKYFTATLQNATNQSVTWLVNGIVGGNSVVGWVNTAGRYVAPAAVPTPAIVQVQARSVQYPTLTASVPSLSLHQSQRSLDCFRRRFLLACSRLRSAV